MELLATEGFDWCKSLWRLSYKWNFICRFSQKSRRISNTQIVLMRSSNLRQFCLCIFTLTNPIGSYQTSYNNYITKYRTYIPKYIKPTYRESFALWDINIFGSCWMDWIRGRSWWVYTSLCHHFSCFLACNRPIECFFQVSFFVQPFAFWFNWMIFDVVFPWRGYRFLE